MFLLLVNMFNGILALTMIVTPVLLSVMVEPRVDHVHFGIVLVVSLGISFSTPPLGKICALVLVSPMSQSNVFGYTRYLRSDP